MIFSSTKFLISVAKLEQLPEDKGCEIAFIGRSNAGKSSAINAIVKMKRLAKTGKTPGCTKLINFFAIDEKNRLVDLPGYGYTKAPSSISKNWLIQVNKYLQIRKSLRCLVLVMDVRHPLKEQDKNIINWACACKVPLHILLTKADKLSKSQSLNVLRKVEEDLKNCLGITVQLFSALRKISVENAREKLTNYLDVS